ncbi:Ribosomal RNA small subunit methyltransferase C [Pseudoalteromonas luteoviolacea B = ATCC 29581]|nr:Ribosomal RNA small subunit methyltransferase C [Pseudoalteromonas luteoviolacea B = ATCC 29581]
MSGTLENPSLLLLRNEDELLAERILVINFARDAFLSELRQLNPSAEISAFSYNIADIQTVSPHLNIQTVIDTQLPQCNFDLIIYYYPKSKPEAAMMFDNIRAIADLSTRLLVVGDNKSGVKSAQKQLQDFAANCFKLESAKHCVLFEFSELISRGSFSISDYEICFDINVANTQLSVISVPGVFNHGSLDQGTSLLLNHLPVFSGDILDFGCGAGIISSFIAKTNQNVSVSALDVNVLATYSTARTFEKNGITGTTILSDGLDAVTHIYQAIVSNPPFHTGISTDYGISERFFKGAKKHLSKNAPLCIVANSFLKYPPILEQCFLSIDASIKNNKFTIYFAR